MSNRRIVGILIVGLLALVPAFASAGNETQAGGEARIYLKMVDNGWVEVVRGPDQLRILGTAEPPASPSLSSLMSTDSGLFQPYVAHPVGSWPEAVRIGDVNGDGLSDVVMTTSSYFDPDNDFSLFVFLQATSGDLQAPAKYLTSGVYTNPPRSVDIGDVNGDGLADVVVGNARLNIQVFPQTNEGILGLPTAYSTSDAYKIRIGDFNDDGLQDVVGIAWGTDNDHVSVFLQNSSGGLDPAVIYTAAHGGYDDLEVADVNSDGKTDIVVMSGQGTADSLAVLVQASDGSFLPAAYYDMSENTLTHGIGVGDINNDEKQDVVASFGGNSPSSFIATFPQNATGALDPAANHPAYDIPEPVEVGDVDLDQRQDILVAHGGWQALGVFIQGRGGLQAYELYPLPYASHYNPHGLDVGDFNSDGADDVAIADYNHGLVVLYNSASPSETPTPGGGRASPTPTSSPTVTATPTNTPLLATLTSTSIGPTVTSTPTSRVRATATASATLGPGAPSATPTHTPTPRVKGEIQPVADWGTSKQVKTFGADTKSAEWS